MAEPAITIRDARPDELDVVAEVLLAAYAQYSPDPATAPASWLAAFDAYRAEIADVRSRLPHSELIVAERDGRIVGSVTFYPPGSDKSDQGWPAEWASIRLLGVAPEGRGAGVGRALTEECVRRARERGAAVVGLHTSNLMEVARGMYERMGFARIPGNEHHPAPEVQAWGYRLDL